MAIEIIKTTKSIDISKSKTEVKVAAPTTSDLNDVFNKGINEGYNNGVNAGYDVGYNAGLDVGYNNGYTKGNVDGYASGKTDGYTEGYSSGSEAGYSAGYGKGTADGFENGKTTGYNEGYNEGKASATLSGITSFTEATKTLVITGLPAEPKKINMYSSMAIAPTDDNQYFIRGLDYEAEGFYYGTSTLRVMAAVWLSVSKNVSNTAAGNGSISEKHNNQYNIFSYANGTLTIKMMSTNSYYFGENYTYRWTIVF